MIVRLANMRAVQVVLNEGSYAMMCIKNAIIVGIHEVLTDLALFDAFLEQKLYW